MLADLLEMGLRAVIVGTAVGEKSAARGHYYAGPGNEMWLLLHEAGLTNARLSPGQDHQLPLHGVGLTDLAKNVAQSHDRGLVYDVPAFASKIERFQPDWVGFNGKEAAKAFTGQRHHDLGRQVWCVSGRPVFVLPSTSGANRRATYDGRATRLEWWLEFGVLVRG
jgi:double-stranded uracil-DNA glycosylase